MVERSVVLFPMGKFDVRFNMTSEDLRLWLNRWNLSDSDGARVLFIHKSKMSEYLSGERLLPKYSAGHVDTFNELSISKAQRIIKRRCKVPNGNI